MQYIFHFLFFAMLYFIYFFPFWHQSVRDLFQLHLLFFSYLYLVFYFTIIPLPNPFQAIDRDFLSTINFLPFRDVIHGYLFAKREAVLNILMMIPFGYLTALITKKRLVYIVLASCLFSICIETSQLLTIFFKAKHPRIVDITDVINNTFGGYLGYLIYQLLKKDQSD